MIHMKRFALSFVMPIVLSALFAIGCGGKVEESDPLAATPTAPVCKFPSASYVSSYVETEGTCGPQADELVTPKAPIARPDCTRSTAFVFETCQYTYVETCKSYKQDGTYLETTNTYDLTLVGNSGGTGTLKRTIVRNDSEDCASTYSVTWM